MLYLEIFETEYKNKVPITGIRTPTDYNYLKRLYQFNYDSIIDYYSTRNYSVKNTNIISRLVEHFPTLAGYESYRYLEYSTDKTKYLAKHFKFTSDIEKGIVHPSYFFGNDGSDIIISSYQPFNIKQAEVEWKTINCISTLLHNRNDIKMLLPLGTDDSSRSGLNSLMVNIPLLAIKYREFCKEQTYHEYKGEGTVLNKNHFVIKHVLPPMVSDIFDHVILNKLKDRFYGNEEITPKYKHKFKLFEPTTQLNRFIENTLDNITNKNMDYINVLRNIHLLFNKDASDLLAIPEIGTTRQSKWAIIASRLSHMLFIFEVASKSKDSNRHYLNDWSRLAKRLYSDNDLEGKFSYDIEKEVKENLYKLKQL